MSNNAPANSKKEEPIAVAAGPGSNTRFGSTKADPTARDKKWEIAWQSANLAYIDKKQSGYMFKVKGKVFENGEPAGEFSADRAEADKAADRLILDGGISISSAKAKLTAKKVEWLADQKLFKASGDVTLDGQDGVIGPVDVLYASAKLEKVASSLTYFQKIKK